MMITVLPSCLDSTLRLLDRSTGELLQEYKGHTCKSYKMDCYLANTDAHVAGGSEDGFIFCWDLVDASVVSRFRAHASVIDKLQATFHQWKQTPSDTGEHVHLTKEFLASCESIEWQVDEMKKAIAVAARDPAWYGLEDVELERRRKWTSTAHNQVGTVRRAVEAGKGKSSSINGMQQELIRLPSGHASQAGRSNHFIANNDDFISSESDRQLLLIKRQDEELDELSDSIQRIGGVGLTIHEELVGQERILDELSMEMETTSNRLDFVQKKVARVMKKAGAKGQLMMIAFLTVLFIILFVLVFFT